jgi:Holliday junction resolvase-like predicted endonuclease
MNELPPDQAAALGKAARVVESCGLTMLDRDREAGGHRLDLAAVTRDGTLAAVAARAAGPDAVRADAADIPVERMPEILHAGAALMRAHEGRHGNFRVDLVAVSLDGPGESPAGHAGENAGAGL